MLKQLEPLCFYGLAAFRGAGIGAVMQIDFTAKGKLLRLVMYLMPLSE